MIIFARFTDSYFKTPLVIPLDKILSIEKATNIGSCITLIDGSQRFATQTVDEITDYLGSLSPKSHSSELMA